MPIPLTTDQRELLNSRALAIRTLIVLYLDSGTYRFWDGDFNWTPDPIGEPTVTYIAVSDVGEVTGISLGKDLGAEGIELKLNGTKLLELNPDIGDPGALFGTIEEENYQLRRVDIRFAFFNAETSALVLDVRRFAGFIDQVRQVEEIGDDGKFTAWLIVSCESIARRYGVRGGRTRSHDDQQDLWPGDTFFKFTASAIEKQGTLYWGRRPPRVINLGGHPFNVTNPRLLNIFD